jgi:hypothetical protein
VVTIKGGAGGTEGRGCLMSRISVSSVDEAHTERDKPA